MPGGRPTELALVHAVDTAPDAPALIEALEALEASWAETGAVHDMDVVLMALHPHIASPHAGVRDAAMRALETMLSNASFTTLNMLTLVRTCVPAVLARLHDAPRAETLLRHVAQIVYSERAEALSVRESDAPHTVFERLVRDHGLAATSPHVRRSVLRILPTLQQDGARLPVRMYLTELADNLQHADAHVREAAKAAILALLHDAPPALKSELRDELSMRDVHRAVLDEITHGLGAAKAPLPDELTSFSDDIRPVYLLSRYDLDHAFQQAAQALEGKETELNWQPREKAVVAMRGMICAEVPPELVAPFLAHIRQAQDGLLKTVRRTTDPAREPAHDALDAYDCTDPPAGPDLWHAPGANDHRCVPHGAVAHGRLYQENGSDGQPSRRVDHPRMRPDAACVLAHAPGRPPGQERRDACAHVQAHPGCPQRACAARTRAPRRPRGSGSLPQQGAV